MPYGSIIGSRSASLTSKICSLSAASTSHSRPEWAANFGLKFAHLLRHRSRGHFSDKWQLDEMVVTIKGKKYWLWRAVDGNGYVLDALLQSRRNKAAALKLMRKLLKHQGAAPRVMVTDKLHSYSAAKSQLMPRVEHRSHKELNNRGENSHLVVRRREWREVSM